MLKQLLKKVWEHALKLWDAIKFKMIVMPRGNRMFRPIAIGHNDFRFYIRIDLWWVGWRVARKARSRSLYGAAVAAGYKGTPEEFIDVVRGPAGN